MQTALSVLSILIFSFIGLFPTKDSLWNGWVPFVIFRGAAAAVVASATYAFIPSWLSLPWDPAPYWVFQTVRWSLSYLFASVLGVLISVALIQVIWEVRIGSKHPEITRNEDFTENERAIIFGVWLITTIGYTILFGRLVLDKI